MIRDVSIVALLKWKNI